MTIQTSSFVPQYSIIQAITLGIQTVVTFTASCDFIVGQIVSFRVTPKSGTQELNNQQQLVIAVTTVTNPNDTITVNVDSRNYTPFVYLSGAGKYTPATVVPSASGIPPGTVPIGTTLQDCYDNTPPTGGA